MLRRLSRVKFLTGDSFSCIVQVYEKRFPFWRGASAKECPLFLWVKECGSLAAPLSILGEARGVLAETDLQGVTDRVGNVGASARQTTECPLVKSKGRQLPGDPSLSLPHVESTRTVSLKLA